jgi:hypothetical protein
MIARLVDYISTLLAHLIVTPLFWGVRCGDDQLIKDFGGDE